MATTDARAIVCMHGLSFSSFRVAFIVHSFPSVAEGTSMVRDLDFYIYEENAWKKIGTAKTDSNGVASLEYTPTSTGTFQAKAMFSGTTNYAQSSSTSTDLNVAMDYTLYYIGGGMIAVAIIGVVGYIVFRRRKKATPIPKTTEKPKTKKK